jgi:hypothetical protein
MIDEKLRILLQDIGRALASAMAENAERDGALSESQKEEYLLVLGLHGEAAPSSAAAPAKRRPEPEPEFRMNTRDVAFLKSIGIDPTRRVRRRRNR